jgi:formylmethanofuran:tetrahydromethanopterin formyltransferase
MGGEFFFIEEEIGIVKGIAGGISLSWVLPR